jgi:inward rectifier potassium channel
MRLGFTAILTGLTFVRFSRPRAKLAFAANPVVTMHNGKPALMVRVGNGRAAVLTDGTAKPNVFFLDITAEGRTFRRAQELRFERAHISIFDHNQQPKLRVWAVDPDKISAAAARDHQVLTSVR